MQAPPLQTMGQMSMAASATDRADFGDFGASASGSAEFGGEDFGDFGGGDGGGGDGGRDEFGDFGEVEVEDLEACMAFHSLAWYGTLQSCCADAVFEVDVRVACSTMLW